MKFFKQNTSNLFRVFFVLFVISLLAILFLRNNPFTTEVKSYGGSLNEGMVGAPRFINPVLAQSQADSDLTRLIFTPLITIDASGEISYNLVENIDVSKDGLSYTVTLLPNIKFEDGTIMDVDDVIFTVEAIKDPFIKSPLAQKWQGVEMEKIDQRTITFKLVRPYADFLYNLELGIIPQHIWKDINPQEFIFSTYNTYPVGNGAYTVDQIKIKDSGTPERYSLVRSKDANESPYLNNISFSFFDTQEDLIKALNSGDIESAYGISPDQLEDIDTKSKVIYRDSLPRVFALFFNQTEQKIFESQAVRKAITYAIDKDSLVETVFNGYASPIDSPFAFSEDHSQFNQTAAIEILEKDGWKKNEEGVYTKKINGTVTPLEFSIAIPNIDDMRKVAEKIENDLRAIGIVVTIRSYEQGNLNQNIIRPREYESLLFGYEIEKPSDAYAFWHSSQISDPGLNVSVFKDASIDTSLQNLRAQKTTSLTSINEAIINKYPAVFLYTPSYIYILPEKIHDASFSLKKSSDRFNNIDRWYTETRHIWPIFINK